MIGNNPILPVKRKNKIMKCPAEPGQKWELGDKMPMFRILPDSTPALILLPLWSCTTFQNDVDGLQTRTRHWKGTEKCPRPVFVPLPPCHSSEPSSATREKGFMGIETSDGLLENSLLKVQVLAQVWSPSLHVKCNLSESNDCWLMHKLLWGCDQEVKTSKQRKWLHNLHKMKSI